MMVGSAFVSVLLSFLVLVQLEVVLFFAAQAQGLDFNITAGRKTLSGGTPLIIANGGTSGLYPDQTLDAYQDAINTSALPLSLLCDLQLTKDNLGICRTGLNLTTSTLSPYFNVSNTYSVDGVPVFGNFSVDYTLAELLSPNTTAVQTNFARSPIFDGSFNLLAPETVGSVQQSSPVTFWLNVEYASFFQQHPGKNSLASYLTNFLASPHYSPAYLSATEVGILKLIGPTAEKSGTSLVLKILGPDTVEQSTNTTYATLLQNLTDIRTYASGILVPKNLIWPIDNTTLYLQAHTTLVQDAHKAQLFVYAYDFANDQYPNSYNYSFDPIAEYLAYVGQPDFSVDGVLSDFPSTASEAINCYTTGYQSSFATKAGSVQQQGSNKLVISHNGDSGDFPGCTKLAYMGAINGGADYIDCPVQITSDGVPVCREFANLLKSTNVATNHALLQNFLTSYPGFENGTQGVFTFDLPWASISTLGATIYSPLAPEMLRNKAYDNIESILTLADFLLFAKNNSGVGMYIDVQNAVYLRTSQSLDIVDAVINALKTANLTSETDKVLIASEDSSALVAFQQAMPYHQRVYRIPYVAQDAVAVTPPVLQEIKNYASFVAIPSQLVDTLDDFRGNASTYFLAAGTQVVKQAHDQNLTVLYYWQKNEFQSLAFDYRSDPIMQINSLAKFYNVDGIITDFPATVYDFLHKNQCYQPILSTMPANYTMVTVVPGAFLQPPAEAPAPALQVVEPPISFEVPISAPSSPAPSPTAAKPSAASKLSLALMSTLTFASLLLCILL